MLALLLFSFFLIGLVRVPWVAAGSATDPCCCCPELVDVIISGFTACGCVQSAGGYVIVTGHTGITGTFEDVPVSLTDPFTLIGTITYQQYTAAGCGTTVGGPVTTDVYLWVFCEDGVIYVLIFANTPAVFTAFSASGELDEALANEVDCGGGGDPTVAFIVDTITASLP